MRLWRIGFVSSESQSAPRQLSLPRPRVSGGARVLVVAPRVRRPPWGGSCGFGPWAPLSRQMSEGREGEKRRTADGSDTPPQQGAHRRRGAQGRGRGRGGLPRATQFCRLNRNVTLHFAEGSASAASSCDLWQGASGVLGQIAWPLLLNLDSELERDRRRGVSGDPVGIAHPLEEARGTLKNWEGHPTCRAGQRERRPPS